MRPRTISLRLPIAPETGSSYPRGVRRPETRGECVNDGPNAQRPCPFVSCAHHLFLDVTKAGSLKLNFPAPSLDALVENLEKMKQSCALDVAGGEDGEGDGVTLEEVGALMNVTRERIRQMEEKFKRKMREDPRVAAALGVAGTDEYWRTGVMPRSLPGESARRLSRSAGHENAELLEVPDDLFDVFDLDEAPRPEDSDADRASGVQAIEPGPALVVDLKAG